MNVPKWIIRNLNEYGNCYLADKSYTPKCIFEIIGKRVRYRKAKVVNKGFVLEVLK